MDTMRQKTNDYLARAMKQHAINPHMRTRDLYIPSRKTMADMPDAYLRKQLCHRTGGNVAVCGSCASPCTAGKLLLERGRSA